MLKKDINWKPFKPKFIQRMNEMTFNLRFTFCDSLLHIINEKPDILSDCIFFDEVFIKLNGTMCTQNLRYWSDINPHMTVTRSLNANGLMILVGVSVRGILFYFFDSKDIPERFARHGKKRRNIYHSMPCNSKTFLFLLL